MSETPRTWQPMSSAPKDGRWIWTLSPNGRTLTRVRWWPIGNTKRIYKGACAASDFVTEHGNPTTRVPRWFIELPEPLPEPPT